MDDSSISLLSNLALQLIPRPIKVISQKTNDDMNNYHLQNNEIQALSQFRLGEQAPSHIHVKYTKKLLSLEAYIIKISTDKITVDVMGESGILYAIQTIRQLVIFSSSGSIPCGIIEDNPALKIRGLMIDVSRGRVPTHETFTYYLDLMLLLKMNHLQLYTEHTFAYKNHQEVWDGWSPLTNIDIKWLDHESAIRNIELVPNQNSFGHLNHWLSKPSYKHLAESPDGFFSPKGRKFSYPFSLSPMIPETRVFLKELYDELLPNFSSQFFNVGCDETFDLGQGRSKKECEKHGTGKVYLGFIQDIHDLVSKMGKRMLFWADILNNHPELIEKVPDDAIAIEWCYEADNNFDEHCQRLSKTRLDFIVAPGTSSWNSISGRYINAVKNIQDAVSVAIKYGALGTLITDWGDNGHLQTFPIALPPIVLSAGLSWNPDMEIDEPFNFLATIPNGFGDLNLSKSLKRLESISDNLGLVVFNSNLFGLSLVNFQHGEWRHQLMTHKYDESWIRKELSEVRKTADRSTTTTMESKRIKDEIIFSADMVNLALDLIPLHRETSAEETSIPETKQINWQLNRDTHNRISYEVHRLEKEHRRQWKIRFRKGGLENSVIHLWLPLKALGIKQRNI